MTSTKTETGSSIARRPFGFLALDGAKIAKAIFKLARPIKTGVGSSAPLDRKKAKLRIAPKVVKATHHRSVFGLSMVSTVRRDSTPHSQVRCSRH
jgi:hypothetical protein